MNLPIDFAEEAYLDPTGNSYPVPGVPLGGTATLNVQAWRGSATSYASAGEYDRFWAWNGFALAPASSFTFLNPTGGNGVPPALAKSLDGMPAMELIIPEPSTFALAGLGAVALLICRRRKV